MIARQARRLVGSAVIAAHLPGQLGVPFAPRVRLDEQRDRRVRRMVLHAARAVPFYRDFFRTHGIDPRTIRGAADLTRLPVLDKDVVRARPELFVAESAQARRALWFTTSGSTGVPLRVAHDQHSLLANIPFGERERVPVNHLCGGAFRPKELYIGYETSTFKTVTTFYADAARLPLAPKRRFVPLQTPPEEVAAIAEQERPDVLVGYGGWIDLFFKTVAARGLAFRPPKLVMYMGEALPHGARGYIEERFGIPVLSRYNAVESFKIGYFCEQRAGFHVHEDLCHVRVVGDDGRDLPTGRQGRVVISNLVNRATVLLNYPIGDVAALSAEACPCGRSFALLTELEGRVEDVLLLDDGRYVHPRAVWQVFKDDPEVLQYQLTQLEPRRFALALATLDGAAFDRALARALPALEDLLGPAPLIEAQRRHDLDRSAGGKFRAVAALRPAQRPV